MLPPLYLADTCSLRNAKMRDYWEREFFAQPDRKLTILSTVQYELERQKLRPEHREEAQAALTFLNKHQERVILLPEQTEIPKGAVADREIFYHCALQQKRQVVLFTADKRLTQAVLLINPMVRVQRLSEGGKLVCSPSRWLPVYRSLAERYCLYVTAACVNSPAFAALMRCPELASLFRGKWHLSTASLPLLNAQGKELLKELEAQGLAPVPVTQACFDVTETLELTARLLTHCGRKPALVVLADGDNLSDYMELSRLPLSALEHKGYSIGVLKGNGRISLQAEPQSLPESSVEEEDEPEEQEAVTEAPAEPTAVAEPPAAEEQEQPPVQAEAAEDALPQAPVPNAPDEGAERVSMSGAEKRKLVSECLIAGDVKKAGALLEANHILIVHAVQTCFEGHMEMLLPLLNSLSQRKLKVPAASWNSYVSKYMPKEKAALEAHLNDDGLQKAIRRMIKMSMVPADGHAAAIQVLQGLKEQLEGKELTRVQNLIDVASACAAAADVAVAPQASSVPPSAERGGRARCRQCEGAGATMGGGARNN